MSDKKVRDKMSWYFSCIISGSIISIGIGIAITAILVGSSEGATWAWWQILIASISALAGIATFVPIGLLFMVWWAAVFSPAYYIDPEELKKE